MKSLLIVVVLSVFASFSCAKNELYITELSDSENFDEPYYDNFYKRCERDKKKDGTTMCFVDSPTKDTKTFLTKKECSIFLEASLDDAKGKFLDGKAKTTGVALAKTGKERYIRCIVYDFDKLLEK